MKLGLEKNPYDRQLLFALTTMCRDAGQSDEALRYGRRLAELAPHDKQIQRLLNELRRHAD